MLSPQHEALHQIFRKDRGLFARTMLKVFQVEVPVPNDVLLVSTDYTTLTPREVHERRGDSALLVELIVEGPYQKYIVLVVSQTDPDGDAEYRWPYYAAYLHDLHKCPVVLLVVTSKKRTARWARQPMEIGLPNLPCMRVYATVLGPDNMPEITDLRIAREDPFFAILVALTNRRSKRIRVILETLAEALTELDEDTANMLSEFTEAGLGKHTLPWNIWRTLMASTAYPYASALRIQSHAEGRAEGRAEGKAESVIEVLGERGILVDPADLERILACTDAKTLQDWLRRALRVSAVSELFAG